VFFDLFFILFFPFFCGVLPGRESNFGCWDRIPASYLSTTLADSLKALILSGMLPD